MTIIKKRKRYSAGEKARIALDAIKGNMTMAEIVAKYSVHATQVNTWKKQLLQYLPEAFGNSKKLEQAEHEDLLSKLYEEIGRLKVENEFLKKKCDLFAG
jgi:transposase